MIDLEHKSISKKYQHVVIKQALISKNYYQKIKNKRNMKEGK